MDLFLADRTGGPVRQEVGPSDRKWVRQTGSGPDGGDEAVRGEEDGFITRWPSTRQRVVTTTRAGTFIFPLRLNQDAATLRFTQ